MKEIIRVLEKRYEELNQQWDDEGPSEELYGRISELEKVLDLIKEG